MANKLVYWVAAGGIAVAAGLAWWVQRAPSGSAVATAASSTSVAASSPVGGPPSAAPGARGAGGGAGGPGGGTPSVEVTKVQIARLVDDAQTVGSLRSRQSVTLRPEVSGRVVRIAFADGATVRQGQLLIQLDDTLQKAELSQSQAQLSIARANLKRNEELVAQNFVAQRVLDESRASLQVAEAQVQLAQARLARMAIVAPFNGTVGIRSVNLGDYVKDGADLVNLEDTSQLYVDFRMPERYQARLSAGQSVQVQLDALPSQTLVAKVLAIDPLVNADGRALLVRAAMPPAPGAPLRPGLFARVTVVMSVNEAALMVPEEAVVPQGGRQTVFRLEKEGEGDGAKMVSRRTEVTLGLRRGAMVQILEGLAEGDTVVVAGQQRLQRDGTAVRVLDMSRAGAPAGGPPPGQQLPKPERANAG